MSYIGTRIAHDADSHVMETREWLEPFVEESLRGRVRSIYGRSRGAIDAMLERAAQRVRETEGRIDPSVNPIAGDKGWTALGAFDTQERSSVLDALGFASQLVFPTAGLRPVLAARDEEERYGAARAYNRAISAFCSPEPRLLAVAYVPLDDPSAATLAAREAVDTGCAAVMISAAAPGERSPGHPIYDPFWSLLEKTQTPFMLHIGPGTKTQPAPFRNNGRERAPDLHGGGENLRFCDYMMLSFAPQTFLSALVYDGVFMRHPALRGGVIESGAGWVPDFLRQLELAYKSFSRTDPYLKELDLSPAEYIRRAVKFTPFPGEDVGRMIADAGADLFLFSSDYPHPEGTRDPLGRFERTMDACSEQDRDLFYRANFEAMMGERIFPAATSPA